MKKNDKSAQKSTKDFVMTHFSCKFAEKSDIINKLRHIFASVAWTLIGVYATFVVLLHIPSIQQSLAEKTSEALSEKLGTKVSIGTISLGLLNRIVLDNISIDDQQKHPLLNCHRVSAKIDVIEVLRGNIVISSAQIFSMDAKINKASASAPLNCQFIIDSLASKDTTQHTPLNLQIASLVIRNTSVSFDRLDLPRKQGVIDLNHIALGKISSHIMLYELTDDSVSVRLKKLSFMEKNTGFSIEKLSFVADAGPKSATLKEFSMKTNNSDISLEAALKREKGKITDFFIKSNHSSISSVDIAKIVPKLRGMNRTIFVDTNIEGNYNTLNIRNLDVSSSGRSLHVSANAVVHSLNNGSIIENLQHPDNLRWNANVASIHIDNQILPDFLAAAGVTSPYVSHLGSIDCSLTANGNRGTIYSKGDIQTAIGHISHEVSYSDQSIKANLQTNTLHLGTLLGSDAVGDIESNIIASADINKGDIKTLRNANVKVSAPLLTLKGYPYRNVELNILQKANSATASFDIADLNINAAVSVVADNIQALLNGNPGDLRNVDITADINHINPNALGLTSKYESTVFSLYAKSSIANIAHPLDNIDVAINNFIMKGQDRNYQISNMQLSAVNKAGNMREIEMVTDFADIHAKGNFDYTTLQYSLTNLIAQKLPTLPGLPQHHEARNSIQLQANIYDTNVLKQMLDIDIDNHSSVTIDGFIDDRNHTADISIRTDSITYSGTTLDRTNLHIFTANDTLNLTAESSRRDDNGSHFNLSVNGKAANNRLQSVISWNNGKGDDFRGSIHANSQFMKNAMGLPTANISIMPSEVMIGDSLWNVHPARISYSANHLSVRNFLVEHGLQHISIDGEATKNSKDSLVVSLQDVNVAYIMNLINFHSVEFGGFASGTAVAKGLFDKLDAYTDLDVHNFLFEDGHLGTLTVHGAWDNDLGQINVHGCCNDEDVVPLSAPVDAYVPAAETFYPGEDNNTRDGRTDVDGYISIKRNYIDLDIKARNTRLEFMHTYCNSFMDNINAWASGHVRVWGDLSKINLTGDAIANGSVLIKSLNTTYTLSNDSVHFIPNDMLISNAIFYDKHGNRGTISGALHHRYLSRMTFDLDVKADHLLCFDFPTLNGETFCGYVIGTGTCKMTGRPGQITFDIEAYPEKGTEFTYNVSSPDALQNQEFITWRDGSVVYTVPTSDSIEPPRNNEIKELDEPDEDFHTNIYMNFLIHATPESTLKLIMDEKTGDLITFNGNGTLRANYYNKGGMQLFGNYNVERGEYKMTIQQVITKSFEFLPGGTLSFGGDPFEAAINLQAQYVVPSVPLSDLNIGNSFSNNTVRVNCLMNIGGTAGQPQVEFNLNLPQASTDIQQMITSLMDGEEERNQQVLYLLSVGRFYAANNNATAVTGQSQASLAMQSFLSGTLSQQLNNIISDVVLKNRNWNFGANISPGDEGMYNAEYEGLVSGRMFNNRLLINGQFGYRDNPNSTTSFIGDFDVRYLLFPNGNLQVRIYNQTSDRYFTKSSMNTQGIGFVLKHDFNSFVPIFLRKKSDVPKTNTNK